MAFEHHHHIFSTTKSAIVGARTTVVYGVFLGLTSNIWADYSPHLLRARYSPSIYMCGSPKTRRYLLNKSSNTIIWRLNIRQVNKDLYVEVEYPRQVVNQ